MTERHRHRPAAGADRPSPGGRRRLRFGLMSRIALALALVGLLPLAVAALRLIDLNRDALRDQVRQTHILAARTAAARVAATLAAYGQRAEALAAAPLIGQPSSAAARQLLAGTLEADPGLAALVLLNGEGEEVIRAQRRPLAQAVDEALAATRQAGEPSLPRVTAGSGRSWLILSRSLPETGGRLVLIADAAPLLAGLDSFELGEGADLALASTDGYVLAGTVSGLDGFSPRQVELAASLQVTGSGLFDGATGEMLGAYAPVAGSPWFVLSQQPVKVAEATELRMRRASLLALTLALGLVAGLGGAAYSSLVRPVRRLLVLQRSQGLLPAGDEGGGGELAALEASFELLRQRLEDREEIGRVFLGRYQVIEVLGEGAMGTVFRGWDPRLARPVALKTVRLSEEVDEEQRRQLADQLLREATASARISHPNIAIVHDVEDSPVGTYLAMELVDGVGLDALLRRRWRLTPAETLTVARAAAGALAAAHRHGVVHRDVKPSNLLLAYDGGIKVVDFGIAELVSATARQQEKVFGTPGFIAPEVLLGDPYRPPADLFALGVVLYQCLAGRHPFAGKNLQQTLRQTVRAEPPPLHEALAEEATEVSDEAAALADLIHRLLARHPDGRPPAATTVDGELTAIARRLEPLWYPADLPPRTAGTAAGASRNRSMWLPTGTVRLSSRSTS